MAAYCRVSSSSEDQLNSFAAQNIHYTQYIMEHEDWRLVDIYADEGVTGTLGKPARFSAAKRFKMPQKSTFLSCIVFSLYPFSDGTNAGAVVRGNGV